MTFRAFIAVELSGLDEVLALRQEIQRTGAPFKLVNPENIHITLKFLGDTDEALIPDLRTAMEKACEGIEPFKIYYKTMGAFPNQKVMKIIWVGIENAGPLIQIAKAVDEGCSKLGFQKENRPFKPHLTLGRMYKKKRLDNKQFNSMQEMFKVYDGQEMGGCTIDKIILKKSTLTPQGPIYEDVEVVKL